MALVRCKECKKKVSTAAISCPHCGHPVFIDCMDDEESTKKKGFFSSLVDLFKNKDADPAQGKEKKIKTPRTPSGVMNVSEMQYDPELEAIWNKTWSVFTHKEKAQAERLERAVEHDIKLKYFVTKKGFAYGTALVVGTQGDKYKVSLKSCQCEDFKRRHKPCKHMYFLAVNLGFIDKPY